MTVLDEFAKTFQLATKDLLREKKRRERDARAAWRDRSYSDRITIKEAVFEVMEQAAARTSDDGKFTVPTRNLFYAVRRGIAGDSSRGFCPWPFGPRNPRVRPVLTYAELAALGIVPERTLRRLVAVGRVKRSVLRTGRRVRFVKDLLIAELLEAEE